MSELVAPTIETSSLVLHDIQDDRVLPYGLAEPLEFLRYGSSIDAQAAISELASDGLVWAIEKEEESVGICGMRRFLPDLRITEGRIEKYPKSAEIFVSMESEAQRRGIAEEATRGMLAFGFIELGITAFKAATERHNRKAQRLLGRLGAKENGYELRNLYADVVADVPVYEIRYGNFKRSTAGGLGTINWQPLLSLNPASAEIGHCGAS